MSKRAYAARVNDPPKTDQSISNAETPRVRGRAIWVGFGLCVISLFGVFTSPTSEIAGIWSVVLMLVLMFLSVPVGFALIIASLIGLYATSGIAATVSVLSTAPYSAVSDWSLSVLPMFILMGMLLARSGLTTKVYRASEQWLSWLPGGAGIGTVAAGAGLSSVSGSTIAMTYTLGRAGIPEMLRAGFDKRLAVGAVVVAGLPGNLIPPSILLVVYAGIASVPVGPQLIAGVVPGIALAILAAVFIFIVGLFAPRLVGKGKAAQHHQQTRITWRQRFQSLGQIWSLPVVMAVLFGGMFSGVFTPTEAGAAAALVALFLTVYYLRKEKPLAAIADSAFSTVSATAAIFFILIGAEMLTRMMATTGLAPLLANAIMNLGLGRVGFLLVLVLLYLFMGMFFDTISMMLLTLPVLLPILEVMEIDLLWFGVFVVLLGELAMLTPPVGILSYIVHGITKNPDVNLGHDISIVDVFVSVLFFLPVALIFLLILILWPDIIEWLPAVME